MRNIKLKYYLRGLGVGMLITAVIMGVVLPGDTQKLTNAQIREKALELGMVDGQTLVLSDLQKKEQMDGEADSASVPSEKNEDGVSGENHIKEMEQETDRTQDTKQETDSAQETDMAQDVGSGTKMDEEQETDRTQDTDQAQRHNEEQGTQEEPMVSTEKETAEDLTSISRVTGEINAEGDTVTVEIRSGANSYSVSRVLEAYGLVADAKSFDNFLCNAGYSKRIHTGKYLIVIGSSEEEIAEIITGNR